MNILIAVIVLGVLVFVHEFGHFIVAKWANVYVEKFSIGFGPVLLRKIWRNRVCAFCSATWRICKNVW